MIYLVQYDRAAAKLVSLQEFGALQARRAEEARLSIELELLSQETAQEVVLLEASNEDELRKTHRRYFERLEQLLDQTRSPRAA
jgi:hypothetical protein